MNLATPPPAREPETPIVLHAVDPDFHPVVHEVAANPARLRGRLVWLVHQDPDGSPKLPHALEQAQLKEADSYVLRSCFRGKPADKRVYVILYWRVSSNPQADRLSLKAQFHHMLRKCAEHGLTIAAIAVDVDSGEEENRPALERVEAVLGQHLRWVVVPTADRLERDEANFTSRLKRWAKRDSGIYYGATYDDRGFRCAHYYDYELRRDVVERVRHAEQYLTGMRGNLDTAARLLLEAGYCCVTGKDEATLSIYEVAIEDLDKPRSKRLLLHPPGALEAANAIADRVIQAAAVGDRAILAKIALEQSQRLGRTITAENLEWELRIGWLFGINRRGVDSTDLVVECARLRLIDADKQTALLEALDSLSTTRAKHTVTGHDDERLAKLAELQEGRRIRYRLTCDCDQAGLTECKSLGPAPDAPAGKRQDWVYCPKCNGGRGNPGKQRHPHIRDARLAESLPSTPCLDCGSWRNLKEALRIKLPNGIEHRVYKCSACRGAATVSSTSQAPPPSTEATQATNPSPAPPPPAPNTGVVAEADHAVMLRGLNRKQWPQPAEPGQTYADTDVRSGCLPRVLPVLRRHGDEYAFTTTQLQHLAFGTWGVPPDLPNGFAKWNQIVRTATARLRGEGIDLCRRQVPGSRTYLYWTQPLPPTDTPQVPADRGAAP